MSESIGQNLQTHTEPPSNTESSTGGIEALLRVDPIALAEPSDPGLEGRISYALAGPMDAPVVTLLPGGSGAVANSAMNPIWRALSSDHRTLIVETRGSPSVSMEPMGFTTQVLASDVATLLDHLEVSSTFVVGGSLGSMIGQHLAADLGERCLGAVFALSSAGGDPFFRELMSHLAHLGRTDPTEMLRASSLWAAGGDGFQRWADTLPSRTQGAAAPTAEGTSRRFEAAAHHDARERLSSIPAPALVLSGGSDLLLRPALGQALADGLPTAVFELWDEANHMCLNVEPDRFASRCRGFFSAIR